MSTLQEVEPEGWDGPTAEEVAHEIKSAPWSEVYIRVEGEDLGVEEVKEKRDKQVEKMESLFQQMREEVEAYRSDMPELVKDILRDRKERLEQQREVRDQLDVPEAED